MEDTCDKVALISNGHIVDICNMNDIRNRSVSDFKIEFNKETDYNKFLNSNYKIIRKQDEFNQVTIEIDKNKINDLFKDLKNYDVKFISEVKYTLEKHFKEKLGGIKNV